MDYQVNKKSRTGRHRGCGVGRGAVLIVLWAAIGCGGQSTTELAGTVTIGGEPIPTEADAKIGFTAEGAPPSETISAPIESGTYRVSGVPVGKVLASFHIVMPVGPSKISERTGLEYQETRILVPPQSLGGVKIEVPSSGGQKDFDL